MKLFVGLGNPGAKYAQNRHNIGFMALDRIAKDYGFSPWRSKFRGQLCEGRLGDIKVQLLKPTTFMNLSGQSVGEAARFHKIPLNQITVFHDELDLAPGKMRLKQGGGHNGLRDIINKRSGDKNFHRLRLGIGHPGNAKLVTNYVLKKAPLEERRLAHSITKRHSQWGSIFG